jgi:hypothetical protein
VDGFPDRWMFPVQVRLLIRIQMQVVFSSLFLPLPGAAFSSAQYSDDHEYNI